MSPEDDIFHRTAAPFQRDKDPAVITLMAEAPELSRDLIGGALPYIHRALQREGLASTSNVPQQTQQPQLSTEPLSALPRNPDSLYQ